jgi:signal transduction histidine kinase
MANGGNVGSSGEDAELTLSRFILAHLEEILSEWEAFARSLPPGATMSRKDLRDDAERMLRFVAADIETAQSPYAQSEKAQGRGLRPAEGSAFDHGAHRFGDRFSLLEMVSEYRALRASVTRLWLDGSGYAEEHCRQLIRFNQAIDQILGESLQRFEERLRAHQSVILGILGHDLRSPLNVVSLSAARLSTSAALTPKEREAADRIVRSAERIGAIASDLIELAQVEVRGGIAIKRVACDLVSLVEEILDEARALHPHNRLEFVHPARCEGEWDCARLKQLVSNLVVNAIQHGTPQGAVKITVEARATEAVLSVENDANPIRVEDRNEMFVPFRRGSNAGASATSVGLGLYIVREIARAHGGDAVVAKSDATGTQLLVRLPR